MEMKNRASWSGQFAFILAAAASAIGLGNLWRFPYLVAQYGGGVFILIYLLLVVTFGFTLMLTEIAIGRRSQQSQLTAYTQIHRGWGFIGILSTLIPFIIVPYYCVIGGWVLKYAVTYAKMAFTGAPLLGEGAANSAAFFGSFISSSFSPFFYGLVFVIGCAVVIVMGVKNGIEKSNLILMPLLFILALAISIYVVCMPGSSEGLRYYFVPDFGTFKNAAGNFSFAQLAKTILGAMGQMFYSLSLAMGIMITYGSYMKRENNIEASVRRIEIFDTIISIIAGLMIIPVVYAFAVKTGVTPELLAQCGGDNALAAEKAVKSAMNAGPGLMFVTLPRVFASIGAAGAWLGMAFFILVIFAAATSAISLYEACVASVCDVLKINRKAATFFTGVTIAFLSVFSALGYGVWDKITVSSAFKALGFTGGWTDIQLFKLQFLDMFDFMTSSFLMPIVAVLTCIFIGWIVKPKVVIDEVEQNGHKFRAKGFYCFMIRYFAPLLLTAILISEICRNLNIKGWAI